MKLLLMLIVAGSAAYFGYKHEPDLRPFITGTPQAVRPSIPDSLRDIDLASLRADQLPKEVTIFITRPFKHSNGNLEITILPGSKHAPVKISPPNVHLRVEGTKYQFVLPIDKTDLIEQLSQMSLDSAPAPTNTEPALPKPQSPSAQPTPSSTVSPKPTPTAPSTATSTDAVMLMRDTLRNNPLKEFSTSQITMVCRPAGNHRRRNLRHRNHQLRSQNHSRPKIHAGQSPHQKRQHPKMDPRQKRHRNQVRVERVKDY